MAISYSKNPPFNPPHTRFTLTRPGLLRRMPGIISKLVPDALPCIVCDENTWRVAGKFLGEQLSLGVGTVPHLMLTDPKDDYDTALEISVYLQKISPKSGRLIPLAVGSGTITDLVRLAAFLKGMDFISVPTAPSMDGYLSAGSPVLRDGFKKTIQCRGPLAVLADLRIIRRAPALLRAAGAGDLLGKIIAGMDWLAADYLNIEAINYEVFTYTQESVRAFTKELVKKRGKLNLKALLKGLNRTSLAMQATGSSRPASGCEHFISHVLDMMPALSGSGNSVPRLHGLQVGFGTALMTVFTEELMEANPALGSGAGDRSDYPDWEKKARAITALFSGTPLLEPTLSESKVKHLSPEALIQRRARIRDVWPRLESAIKTQLTPFPDLVRALNRAGCPWQPQDFGLSPDNTKKLLYASLYIRSRYSILDLAAETGLFYSCVEKTVNRISKLQ